MMQSFDPSQETSGYLPIIIANPGGSLILFNKSQYGMTVDFGNGRVAALPAWYVRTYKFPTTIVDHIDWQVIYTLNQNDPPISLVMGELYEEYEVVPQSDGPIPWLSNVGNTVTTSGTNNQVVNEGNVAGNPVIQVQQTGVSVGWNAEMLNDGTFILQALVASVLTNLFATIPNAAAGATSVQIGDASRVVEIFGKLLADLGISLPNNQAISSKDTGGTTHNILLEDTSNQVKLLAGGANNILLVDNSGNTLAVIDGNGFHVSKIGTVGATANLLDGSLANQTYLKGNTGTGTIHMQANATSDSWTFDNNGDLSCQGGGGLNFNIGRIKDFNTFTGTGSGTYSHGLSGAPAWVCAVTDIAGSATQGYDSGTSSTVHVTLGAAIAFKAVAWR